MNLVLPGCLTPAEAAQNCAGDRGVKPTIIAPVVLTGHYDPQDAADTVLTGSFTIMAPPGFGPCTMNVGFVSMPNGMAGPAGAHLGYGMSGDFGQALGANYSALQVNLVGNGRYTGAGAVVIPARQAAQPGAYGEQLSLALWGQGLLLFETPFSVSLQVTSSCTMPAPSSAHLDFSPGVHGGRVTAGYTQSTVINGASCNGPSVLTLRGQPLATSAPAAGGFANGIPYTVTARFGASTAVLGAGASSAQTSLPATTGNLQLDVGLVDPGLPLAGGAYTSTLTIGLEPAN